ncbi:MAG: tRNA-binding protein [Rhodospirillales bacterium]|jgi:tRNA-binding protein|nr:tRNA-binding protein [Rhodospirillales bacterium]MDP6805450.1 tRNA-binding protein [Rhodospirillales bacterium]
METSPMEISYDDFTKIDIRAGTVVRAETHKDARVPALKVWVDFGPEIGEKRSSAQIVHHYAPEALVGHQIAAVVNFPPKRIGGFLSECLVLGFADARKNVVLVGPDHAVPNGARLF